MRGGDLDPELVRQREKAPRRKDNISRHQLETCTLLGKAPYLAETHGDGLCGPKGFGASLRDDASGQEDWEMHSRRAACPFELKNVHSVNLPAAEQLREELAVAALSGVFDAEHSGYAELTHRIQDRVSAAKLVRGELQNIVKQAKQTGQRPSGAEWDVYVDIVGAEFAAMTISGECFKHSHFVAVLGVGFALLINLKGSLAWPYLTGYLSSFTSIRMGYYGVECLFYNSRKVIWPCIPLI